MLELYIIGSVLVDENIANDVDIVQRIYFKKGYIVDAYSQSLKEIKEEFYSTFSKSLHVTTFTQNENLSFEYFISLNNYIRII